MENFADVKLEIFVPQEYALKIRDQLAKIRVGRIGDYDHCVAIYTVPFTGEIGRIQETTEAKVEVNCKRELVNEAINIIRRVHPYEEPLVNVIPLANHLFDMKSMSGQ